MDAELNQAVKDVGEAAKARNSAAGDTMYDALHTLKDELFCANPNIEFMQRVVMRAIPK